MFNSQKDQSKIENIDPKQFIIIYSDKIEKRFANILSEKISKNSKNLRAVVWSKKQYDDSLPRLSSTNKKLAFGKEFQEEFASDPNLKDTFNEYGIHIRIDGNSCLIYRDAISLDNFKIMIEEWKKRNDKEKGIDVAFLTASAILSPIAIGVVLYRIAKMNKSVSILQYSFAIDILQKSHLESFLADD